MQEFSKVINKPVVSIYDCTECGTSNKVFVSKNWKCEYISLNKADIDYIIRTKDILNYNLESIMIKNASVLATSSSMELSLQDKYSILGLKVYNLTGAYKGNIVDILLDDKYYITKVKLDNGDEIERSMLFNISNDLVIAKDAPTKTNRYKYKPKSIPKARPEHKEISVQIETHDIVAKENSTQNHNHIVISTTPRANDSSILLNREATKNIVSTNGEVIVRLGTRITRDIIKKARAYGKLFELVRYSK